MFKVFYPLIGFISICAVITVAFGQNQKASEKLIYGSFRGPGAVPIGGMVAIMPSTHANAWQPPATGVIKDGFMRADGNNVPACSDCIIPAGTAVPNMVTKYPRGNTTSGTAGGTNTQASNVSISDHSSIDIAHGHGFSQPSDHSLPANTGNESAHTHSTPSHYHGTGYANGDGSVGLYYGGSSSTSQLIVARAQWTTGSTYGADYYATARLFTTDTSGSGTSGAGSAHSHSIGGSLSHSGGSVTALGSTLKTISSHSITNNAVNNEPAYVEVV